MPIHDLLKYVRNLKYEEEPDYSFIKSKFKSIMEDNNLKNDSCFDWPEKTAIEELCTYETDPIEITHVTKESIGDIFFKKTQNDDENIKDTSNIDISMFKGNQDRTIESTILNKTIDQSIRTSRKCKFMIKKRCNCNIF